MPFAPTLPDQARDPAERARELEQAQQEHEWDWSWPPGCATLRALPDGDRYPLRYVAKIGELSVELSRNHARLAVGGAMGAPPLPSSVDDLEKDFFSVARRLHEGAPRTRPSAVGEYADYFATLPAPPILTSQTSHPELSDALFAWQRVAGANPMAIHRVSSLPDDFAVTEAHWRAAGQPGSLDEARAEGRLYAVDYTRLHGAPCTRYLGRQKYLCGARGLFTQSSGSLLPVAIQLEPGGPVVTPKDGASWAMARYCLQVADANVHEAMEHLGATHMVVEAVGIAARRQLSGDHPLRRLLEPHIEGTFAINNSAKTGLIAPGGVIDQVFAARIDVAASLVRVALDGFVLQDRAPAKEIEQRGMGDRSLVFPYRDDVTAVYEAIRRFAEAYVRLYYPGDERVAGDVELQAWVAEVGSPIGGALKGVRPVTTVEGLAEWMANVIHIASAQHAAVNFPQYPFFGWGANAAGALWGEPPRLPLEGGAAGPDPLSLMPPWDCLLLQANTVFQLSSVYYNKLGDYGVLFDIEPHVRPVVEAFKKDLAEVDAQIASADQGRLLPYSFLRPGLIPASINI